MIVELTGDEGKASAPSSNSLEPFGIIELARTGAARADNAEADRS
ncbi:MAG: hypothetical protein U5L01_02020 [Rheinheimera sp.]|nr:hypothetical protein [Rheinheimera sp.]